MGKGGGGGGGTTVTKSEPWDEQKGYLREAMQSASDLYNASFDKRGTCWPTAPWRPPITEGTRWRRRAHGPRRR